MRERGLRRTGSGPRGVRASRTPRGASGLAVGLAGTLWLGACGVQRDTVEVVPVRPTLFPPTYTAAPSTTAAPGATPPRLTTTTTTAPPRPVPTVLADGTPRAVVTATGVVAAVASVRADGAFVIVTPCGNEVAVAKAVPVVGVNVVLDPGHGGLADPGATGPQGTKESEIDLAVALAVKERLEATGVKVLLTRTGDTPMTLSSRARLATALKPDAFVSIHHDGGATATGTRPGTVVYHQADDEVRAKRLAGLIHEEVVAALATQQVAWATDGDAGVKVRLDDRGADYYGVLRNAVGVPSVFLRPAFVTNAPEEALLRTDAFRALEAGAIARGILRYLTSDDPGSGYAPPSSRPDAANGSGGPTCVDPPLQ